MTHLFDYLKTIIMFTFSDCQRRYWFQC